MKVLVTGATGLVGKELVELLLSRGISLHYLTTSKEKLKDEAQYKGFYWNPKKGFIDKACLEDVVCIIHLAGASISGRWTKAYKREILDSRVVSTNLLYGLLKTGEHTVQHFISASAIGIYSDSLTKVYSESEKEVDDSFLGEVVTKWERAVHQIEGLGIRTAIIRTGIVLSGRGGALPQMAMPVKFGLGSPMGSGKQIQSWIHIDDLVNIYLYACLNGLQGIFNAVAPHPVTNNVLMRTIAKVLSKPYFMPGIPRFVLRAILGEMYMLLFTSQNVSAKKLLEQGYHFKFVSLESALADALK